MIIWELVFDIVFWLTSCDIKDTCFPFFLFLPFFSSCTEETPKRLYQLSAATRSTDNDDSSLPARAFWGVYVCPLKEKKKQQLQSASWPCRLEFGSRVIGFQFLYFAKKTPTWSWDSQDFCRVVVFIFFLGFLFFIVDTNWGEKWAMQRERAEMTAAWGGGGAPLGEASPAINRRTSVH